MTEVSLVRCETYEPSTLDGAVEQAVGLLGGISRFVKPGHRVLLKPNLLSARSPDRRVTTDPRMVRSVAHLVQRAGGKPFIGDSPAIEPFARVARKTGMAAVAEELGIELVELNESIPVSVPGNSLFKRIEISRQALEADVVINLPKLKTHTQMLLTLGVKNLFGTVVAQRKAEWHYMTGLDRQTFASLHLDIYLTVKPALTVLDGVWGMQGHGPANGTPHHTGLIAAAQDAVALDLTICHLVGAPLKSFPLHRAAKARGIGETEMTRVTYKGESPASLRVRDFDSPALDSLGVLPELFDRFARRYLVSRPFQDDKACAQCGQCTKICPANAVEQIEERLIFDYDRCIRCYCCQEVCPEDAIHFKKGLIVRALNRFRR